MIRLALALALIVTPVLAQTTTTKTLNTVQTPARVSTNGSPSVLIPPSSIGIDLCLGEGSGAYATSMLAITFNAPLRDSACSLLRQSKWAADLGHPEVAYQIMCASGDWKRADAKGPGLCR